MHINGKGIEFTLLESWVGWDEHGPNDLYFYNVKLKPEVFGEELMKVLTDEYDGAVIDVGLFLSSSLIEIYVQDMDDPVFTKNLKLVLV